LAKLHGDHIQRLVRRVDRIAIVFTCEPARVRRVVLTPKGRAAVNNEFDEPDGAEGLIEAEDPIVPFPGPRF